MTQKTIYFVNANDLLQQMPPLGGESDAKLYAFNENALKKLESRIRFLGELYKDKPHEMLVYLSRVPSPPFSLDINKFVILHFCSS